ncbi:hypothetical protein DFH08DRAFT_242741 [Mycena albidolilacea]|uniref:Uncharacterized protein n=1 Tax=Mycena albidolilacea TaxID=1033008 RepID=A0AAD6ZUL5_9AGAR|nr:hypothetical protein DFH08DRAFT_242741 [Mycena albidolilacea]
MRIANQGGACTMIWGWRWIRACRCVAPIPFLPCLPYIHAPGRPSLTQPSHTAPAQRRRCLKVKSDAQARNEPCACPSSAARPRLQRALSRHALHARRSPSRLDPTSSSGRFQLYTHPARPLHLRSVDSACTSPLTPEHRVLTPATNLHPAQIQGRLYDPARARDAGTGSSHPHSLSCSYPVSLAYSPSSLALLILSLTCRSFEPADVNHASARMSSLALACARAGVDQLAASLRSANATSRCTCPSPGSTPNAPRL